MVECEVWQLFLMCGGMGGVESWDICYLLFVIETRVVAKKTRSSTTARHRDS